MAVGARERSGADCGLSVTGEAGPESSSPGIDPGAVWVGVATPKRAFARLFRFPGTRERVRSFAAQTAMNLLRLELR
jgi:nicotinamide mononucleotide (NMN) deamidase PncC